MGETRIKVKNNPVKGIQTMLQFAGMTRGSFSGNQPFNTELERESFYFKVRNLDKIKKNHLTGDIRYHNQFPSKYLHFKRDIIIYLPPSYHEQTLKRYPVLYMHDGNNLFDPETSFAGVPWAVNDTVQRLIHTSKIEELIIVGIWNTPARTAEYTWTPMQFNGDQLQGGHGKKYARFMANELKPFIDRSYRTLSDRENTAVIGSSLGGLISFYLACYYGDIFSKVGLMSPSLWWGYGEPFQNVSRLRPDLKIWLDMGAFECCCDGKKHDLSQIFYSTRLMKRFIVEHGYVENKNFIYFEDMGGRHDERSWGRRVHRPLEFFFGQGK